MDRKEKITAVFREKDLSKLEAEISLAGDELEYGEMSREEVISSVNCLLAHVKADGDPAVTENILHVCLRIMNAHRVFSGFELDTAVSCLHALSAECRSYILTFLGFSGDMKYKKLIEGFLGEEALRVEAEEALRELEYAARAKGARHTGLPEANPPCQ